MRTLQGNGIVLADLGLLAAIWMVGRRGPASLRQLDSVAAACLGGAALFAILYDGSLLLDLLQRPLPLTPYALFLGVGVAVSIWAAARTGSFVRGVLAATWALVLGTVLWSVGWLPMIYSFWGTKDAYRFWLADGAISDYQHSGGSDVSVFLIQDVQGALFFHPWLCVGLGLACGAVGAGLGRSLAGLGPAFRRRK
jgi:hypothetical protein